MGLKTNRRRHYDEAFKCKIVQDFIASKQTLSAFSKTVGIDNSIIHRWAKQYYVKYGSKPLPTDPKSDFSDDFVMLKAEIANIKETIDSLRRVLKKAFKDKYDTAKHP